MIVSKVSQIYYLSNWNHEKSTLHLVKLIDYHQTYRIDKCRDNRVKSANHVTDKC